ncbi:MAG TPA: hypothetical protein VLF68_02820 [Candidatus Saccharimonadales bacterium]|nr:hypothetical protein [Candidatus Saccharimonadales bacterium]
MGAPQEQKRHVRLGRLAALPAVAALGLGLMACNNSEPQEFPSCKIDSKPKSTRIFIGEDEKGKHEKVVGETVKFSTERNNGHTFLNVDFLRQVDIDQGDNNFSFYNPKDQREYSITIFSRGVGLQTVGVDLDINATCDSGHVS